MRAVSGVATIEEWLGDVVGVRVRDDAVLARPVGVEPQVYVRQVQPVAVFDSQHRDTPSAVRRPDRDKLPAHARAPTLAVGPRLQVCFGRFGAPIITRRAPPALPPRRETFSRDDA